MMDAVTLKALKGSIKKWELIVAGKGADDGVANCPLCVEFLSGRGSCDECPVGEGCCGTPYDAWSEVHYARKHPLPFLINDDDSAIAAVLELEYLRSLLPEGK